MSPPNPKSLDCAMMTYADQVYIMPIRLIAEVEELTSESQYFANDSQEYRLIGADYQWYDMKIPMIAMNVKPYDLATMQDKKVAIINSPILSIKCPFIAVLFSKTPQKIRIKPENISWQESSQERAVISTASILQEVTIFDLSQNHPLLLAEITKKPL